MEETLNQKADRVLKAWLYERNPNVLVYPNGTAAADEPASAVVQAGTQLQQINRPLVNSVVDDPVRATVELYNQTQPPASEEERDVRRQKALCMLDPQVRETVLMYER